jgi:ABC-2 type transport system ATP-binding protein
VIADAPVAQIVASATGQGAVRVRSPHADRLATAIAAENGTATPDATGLTVVGIPTERIGELAARDGIVLHELTPVAGSLEDAYLALTQDEVEYHAGGAA